MPTYEYICQACGENWEAEQRITEAPIKDCPHCGQDMAKRQISGGGTFILKGGGWYADLYSSSKKSGESSSSPKGSTASKPAEATGTEAKTSAAPSTGGAPTASSTPSTVQAA